MFTCFEVSQVFKAQDLNTHVNQTTLDSLHMAQYLAVLETSQGIKGNGGISIDQKIWQEMGFPFTNNRGSKEQLSSVFRGRNIECSMITGHNKVKIEKQMERNLGINCPAIPLLESEYNFQKFLQLGYHFSSQAMLFWKSQPLYLRQSHFYVYQKHYRQYMSSDTSSKTP